MEQGKSSTLGQMRLNVCLKKAGKRNWLTGNGNITARSVKKAKGDVKDGI